MNLASESSSHADNWSVNGGYSTICRKTNAAGGCAGRGLGASNAAIRGTSIASGGAGNVGLDGSLSDGSVGPADDGLDGRGGATGTASASMGMLGLGGGSSGARYVWFVTPGSPPATGPAVTAHEASRLMASAYCAKAGSDSTSK